MDRNECTGQPLSFFQRHAGESRFTGGSISKLACEAFRCDAYLFFSSGMADHALRLGPYMRRSCK